MISNTKARTALSCILVLFSFGITGLAARAEPTKTKPARKTPRGALYIPGGPSVTDALAPGLLGRFIKKIDVTGLKRIEKDAVLNKLTSKVGSSLSREGVRADIQTLFNMGFFEDIEFSGTPSGAEGIDLRLALRERPVIARIEFDGNERISTNDLKEIVKIKEWAILDINRVKDDVALLQRHYEDKGFYLAKVSFELRKIEGKEDEIEVTYKVNDFEKVQIKKITFLNNKKFSDTDLKSVLRETKEGSFFSFLSSTGTFKESAFKEDLKILTYWYLDHGYVKFRYENPVVTVSDDKKWVYISVFVDEGEQYTVGKTEFSGDLLFTKEELNVELTLLESEVFSISKRNADIQRLTEKYQDLGYAFVNVVPKMDIKDDMRVVDMVYDFEKGSLVHFGEINILGNSKTHDKVIRRELKIHEGELFSGTKLRESRENVERLGYFSPGEVVFNQVTPKDKPDILNIEIQIKERSTGTITLGAGYGSLNGLFFQTQIQEINLFGRGQSISLSGQYATSAEYKNFNLGVTEPYTFDTRWSSGADFYYTTFPIPGKYSMRKLGFNLRFGHPITEYTHGFITYKNEGLRLTSPTNVDTDEEAKLDSGVLSSIVWSMVRDKRNNRFETTAGNYQSISLETAGLGGDKKFLKWVFNNRFYQRVWGDLVFRSNLELGAISPISGKPVPPAEKFYLGGPNNLRGYYAFTVGPFRSPKTPGAIEQIPLGGSVEAFTMAELEHPLIREAGLKMAAFVDVGNAWDGYPKFRDYFVVRADWGLGLRWFSPIGPLRFEWGFPFRRKPYESDSEFSFFIGPPF